MAFNLNFWKTGKALLWFILVFIVLAVGTILISKLGTQDILITEDQPAGDYIVIKQAFTRNGGFVVVRLSGGEGKFGPMAAIPRYLFPTIHYQNLKLTSLTPVSNPELQRELGSGDELIAQFYRDSDGNKGFSAALDRPAKNFFGKPYIKKFKLK